MGWSISIGSVKGTAVRLHFTFLLFLAWAGAILYMQGGAAAAASGVTFLLLLFLCVVLHEFGHILAARHFGIRTPEVVLLPIGGVSRLERIPQQPREELIMALAGPAVTLAIAAVLIAALGGLPDPMDIMAATNGRALLAQLAYANLVLLLFNLLPAFPMDGGRVLRALLSARMGHVRGTSIAATIGQILAIIFGLLGLMAGHVILILVGIFVYVAAGAEAGLARVRIAASGIPAREAMVTSFESLREDAPIRDAAEALLRTSQHEFPVVDKNGRVRGKLTRTKILEALDELGGGVPVGHAMQTDMPTVSAWDQLDDALGLLQDGKSTVAVTDADGKLVGLVTWENLFERLLVSQAITRRVRRMEKCVLGPPIRDRQSAMPAKPSSRTALRWK